MRNSGKALCLIGAGALFALGSPALAQSQPAGNVGGDAGSNGDIVVTATKREQSLSRVGLTVSAIGADALANQRIANVADLARAVPGLTFTPSPNATPVYTLRGVGFYETSLAAYPDVAVYLDQTPLSLPIMASLTAFDLERVEVLKGPQGTLFGNNATGGAINFVAAKPTRVFSAGTEFSYGRFNTLETAGYISGPITDTLRARIAIKATNGGAWQKSYTRNDTLGRTDNIAARLILDWDATEALKFSLNLNGWRDQSEPQAPQRIANVFQRPALSPLLPIFLYPFSPQNARAADWNFDARRPRMDNSLKQATLRTDYDFGGVNLTALTAYSDTKFRNTTEGDGTSLTAFNVGEDVGRIRSFTQELRLANDASSRLRWVLGANYERTKVFEQTGVYYPDSDGAAAVNIVVSGFYDKQLMRNYAAFGNVEFDLSDHLTLKGGVRQTKSTRSWTAFNGDLPDYPITPDLYVPRRGGQAPLTLAQFLNATYRAIYGPGRVPTIQPGGSIILDLRTNPDGTPVNPATYLTAGLTSGSLDENNTSWSAGVDYKPTDELLFYANVSRGYKAGSFPHLTGSTTVSYVAVTAESLLSYEAGYKAKLFDRRLMLNGAVFYYDYNDKQTLGAFVDRTFSAQNRLVNVPKSRIQGAEIEAQLRPLPGLSVSASGSYVDAKVQEYLGIIGSRVDPATGFFVPITASFKGAKLPYAPKWQYALRGDYTFPVSDHLTGLVGLGANGQSSSEGVITIDPAKAALYRMKGRMIVDGQIGIKAADDRWKLLLWGKNLFNEYYWTNAVEGRNSAVRYTGRPVEYGVTLGFKI